MAAFVRTAPHGGPTIDFADPAAVKALNGALLLHHHGVRSWDLPPGYLCPPVPGAIFVIVHRCGGLRHAVCAGRVGADGKIPEMLPPSSGEEEIHLHLLARDGEAAVRILRDMEDDMAKLPRPAHERKGYSKPVQLELLSAA